jgi:hypothetical protein
MRRQIAELTRFLLLATLCQAGCQGAPTDDLTGDPDNADRSTLLSRFVGTWYGDGSAMDADWLGIVIKNDGSFFAMKSPGPSESGTVVASGGKVTFTTASGSRNGLFALISVNVAEPGIMVCKQPAGTDCLVFERREEHMCFQDSDCSTQCVQGSTDPFYVHQCGACGPKHLCQQATDDGVMASSKPVNEPRLGTYYPVLFDSNDKPYGQVPPAVRPEFAGLLTFALKQNYEFFATDDGGASYHYGTYRVSSDAYVITMTESRESAGSNPPKTWSEMVVPDKGIDGYQSYYTPWALPFMVQSDGRYTLYAGFANTCFQDDDCAAQGGGGQTCVGFQCL